MEEREIKTPSGPSPDVEPFEASLSTDEYGRQRWTTRPLEDRIKRQVCELLSAGRSETDIARELCISRHAVANNRKLLEADGLTFPKSKGGAGCHKNRQTSPF